MSTTVNSAFKTFLENTVRINPSISDKAKASRDYLVKEIQNLSDNYSFLQLCPTYNCYFGSFSRKTKIAPLDDIDIIIALNCSNTQYYNN